MKNILILIAFVFFSIIANGQNKDSIAISKIVENFIGAFNQKDLKLYTSLFAEDADFYNWQGSHTHGLQEIREFHEGVFKRLAGTQLKLLSHSIRFIQSDVAVVVVNEENFNMTSPNGEPLPNRLVNLIWVLKKEKSNWLIKVNHTAMLNDGSKPTKTN